MFLFHDTLQMTNFPLFGVGDFAHPSAEPGGPTTQSQYVPDTVINPHPRFAALTRNIRERRGRKVGGGHNETESEKIKPKKKQSGLFLSPPKSSPLP